MHIKNDLKDFHSDFVFGSQESDSEISERLGQNNYFVGVFLCIYLCTLMVNQVQSQ